VTDLVANAPDLTDRNGIVHAPHVIDPNLVNPWGVAENGASPFWVSDGNQGVGTLYDVSGTSGTTINPLVVGIPTPGNPLSATGVPTGVVFNVDLASRGFQISGVDLNGNTATAPAVFLFATGDGTIGGWNPGINPGGFEPARGGAYGIIAVDNSTNPTPAAGAVYKGLAIATDTAANTFLYATNFRAGTVEVYDTSFNRVTPSSNAFTDPNLGSQYA